MFHTNDVFVSFPVYTIIYWLQVANSSFSIILRDKSQRCGREWTAESCESASDCGKDTGNWRSQRDVTNVNKMRFVAVCVTSDMYSPVTAANRTVCATTKYVGRYTSWRTEPGREVEVDVGLWGINLWKVNRENSGFSTGV